MSKLKAINIILQFFFIRLTKCSEKVVGDYKVISYDMMPDGSVSSRGIGNTITYEWYSLQYFILPLTGWWSDFIYLSKTAKFIKCTKRKQL